MKKEREREKKMGWRIQLAFVSLFFLASTTHHLFHHLFLLHRVDVVVEEDAEIHLPPPQLTTSCKAQVPTDLALIREPAGESNEIDRLAGKHPHSILFHDWEVFLVLPPAVVPHPSVATCPYSCVFQDGATSPATPVGVLPAGSRHTFKCSMPNSVRRLRPFVTPALSPSPEKLNFRQPATMLRWNLFAYESLSTDCDVIVFAKGVNTRPGANLPADSLRCVFSNGVKTAVTSSSQEAFRCPHPTRRVPGLTQISLEIGPLNASDSSKARVLPSVALYDPSRRTLAPEHGKSLLCACTVVYNVAKFLKEWVIYHSAIGVEKFVLYDNGSDDNFSEVVGQLLGLGHDVVTAYWPWPKTQEAGFSHCATSFVDSCTWMMFADVDEFVFSPKWQNSSRPSKLMLQSLLPPPTAMIGQMMLRCFDFGPSNRQSHPIEGVTQGYTCRLRDHRRHKSIVLLDGVDPSLGNVVHHFKMKEGYSLKRLGLDEGVVKHYKYQAWAEFKHKFRRRVSAYVNDWRKSANPDSRDRVPGLGNEPIEPHGWASKFCEVNDTGLRDVSRSWFGLEDSAQEGGIRLAWQR